MNDISIGRSAATLASIGAFALAPLPSVAADAAGARAFLEKIYAHYPTAPGRQAYFPTGPVARRVFDPEMVALLREDQRLAGGEVGAIDGDPLCDCQDDDGLSVSIEDIRLTGASSANAAIALRFNPPAAPAFEQLAISLVVVAGRWRIHDIRSKDTPSLRAYLIQENRFNASSRP